MKHATNNVGRHESPNRRLIRRFFANKLAVGSLVFLLIILTLGILTPVIVPHSPTAQDLNNVFAGPSGEHLLGTDELGRDYLSRMISATGATLYVGMVATGVSLLIGLPLGIISGYAKGFTDSVIGRVNDAVMAIPAVLLALGLVAVLGASAQTATIAIGVANIPRFYRVARASTLVVREETYIEAAKSVGSSNVKIMTGHVLPNIASPIVVQVSMTIGFSILIEAGLSFLGLGVQPPEASWGSMLRNATQYVSESPHLVMWPGMAILLSVLAFNFVGDGIRDSIGREVRKF